MKIIAVAGRKRSGKDEFAKPLIEAGYIRMGFSDPLKRMLWALLYDAGFDKDTIERCLHGDLKERPLPILCDKTPREAMQWLGTEWRNLFGEKLWVNILIGKLKTLRAGLNVVIPDLRFQYELDGLMEINGLGRQVRSVRIKRPNLPWNEFSSHPSETAVDNLQGLDYEVRNDGTIFDLRDQARAIAWGIDEWRESQ